MITLLPEVVMSAQEALPTIRGGKQELGSYTSAVLVGKVGAQCRFKSGVEAGSERQRILCQVEVGNVE